MPVMSITEKGQVVIPKELRDKFGIRTNGEVIVTEVAGHIAVLPAPEDPIVALQGSVKFTQPVADIIRELRDADRQRDEKLLRRFATENAKKARKKKQRTK